MTSTTPTPITAYIGIGANLGFARDSVLNALLDLERLPHSTFIAASSLYQSPSMGSDGPDYINAVAEIQTTLTPQDLLFALFAIERQHGRVRLPNERNAPRTLDLDLLMMGDLILDTPDLILPHPRMTERAFVLKPLLELAPDVVIPGKGTAQVCMAAITDQKISLLES